MPSSILFKSSCLNLMYAKLTVYVGCRVGDNKPYFSTTIIPRAPMKSDFTISSSRSPSPPSENDVFSFSHSLVPEPKHKSAGTTDLDFDGLLSAPLILHEDLKGGCGGQLWPAGMTLAKYLLRQQISLHDKHIIEIGAGGGLVGLALAAGGLANQPLLLTDQKPMLALMQKNIQLNQLETCVSVQVYDWGTKPAPAFPTHTGHPDVVLAADCVYFEPAFPLLLQTLGDLIGPMTTCYFCFKKRRKADIRFIREMMKKFAVVEVDYEERNTSTRNAIYLYQVHQKREVHNAGNNGRAS